MVRFALSEYTSKIAIGAIVAVLIGSIILAGFYYIPQISKSSSITTVTGGSITTTSSVENTYFSTSCSISGVGGFEFRTVHDSSRAPVNADSIAAVDTLGCNNHTQVVHLSEFYYMGRGWVVPVFPSQANVGGGLNITVVYQGKTYNFAGYYPPVGTDCVTLSVPSGNVTSSMAMNGSGSYCS